MFIFTLLSILFTYLIFCFCSVYPKTQIILFSFGFIALLIRLLIFDFLFILLKTTLHHIAMRKNIE
jgi:hypothetical protein